MITGPGTPLQSSVGRPVPVTLNKAPAAVAAPVPLEQIMQEQQVQEQREQQKLMVPQSFASTVKGRGRGLKVTITQNTPGPAEFSAMMPRKYVPRPAGRNAPVDQMETMETDDEMLDHYRRKNITFDTNQQVNAFQQALVDLPDHPRLDTVRWKKPREPKVNHFTRTL